MDHRDEDEAPTLLGPYHIVEALREEALGVLYLARFKGRDVGQGWALVRRLRRDLATNAALVRAFFDGARLAAHIQHPNVVTTFDVSEENERPWMAFEYVYGEVVEDLNARMMRIGRAVPWDVAARIVAQAALGVDAIAEMRSTMTSDASYPIAPIVPSKIAVTYDGIAKVFEGSAPATADARSVAYTAPERLSGGTDTRSDIFGLGVILWELVTGRRLFEGKTEQETLALLRVHSIPSVRSIVRCPTKFEEILMCSLARDPGERFQTARALARALDSLIAAKGVVVTDEAVGRYLQKVFPDRFEEQQQKRESGANLTLLLRPEDRSTRVLPPEDRGTRVLPPADPGTRILAPEVRRAARDKGGGDSRLAKTVEGPTVIVAGAVADNRALRTAPMPARGHRPTAKTASARPRPPVVSARAVLQGAAASTPSGEAPPWVPLGVVLVAVVLVVGLKILLERAGTDAAPVGASASGSTTMTLPTANAAPNWSTAGPVPTSTSISVAIPTAAPRTATRAAHPSNPAPPRPPPPSLAAAAPAAPPSESAAPDPPAAGGQGLLTVVCTPPCADVRDGAHSFGVSPVLKAPIPAGDHKLTFRWASPPAEKTVSVTIPADENTVVKPVPGEETGKP